MRLLVLGGTSFLSKQVALDAVTRGHEVVCAARGQSGPAPEGAQLVNVDRDEPGAVKVLAGEQFDAVVDVATGALGWVLEALDVLADRAGHWTFVSSINVYADTQPWVRPPTPRCVSRSGTPSTSTCSPS